MSDEDELDAQPTKNVPSDAPAENHSPPKQASEADEGPGLLGLELSRIKECLHDLATDQTIPQEQRDLLHGFYAYRRGTLQLRLAVLSESEKVKAGETALEIAREVLVADQSEAPRQSPQADERGAILKAESEYAVVEGALVKARTDLHAVSIALDRLHRDDHKWEGLRTSVRRWEKSRKWDAITPHELKAAVEAVRYTFENQACFRPEQSTMKLCYAALHPPLTTEAIQKETETLSPYKRALVAILGTNVEPRLLGPDHPAPVIFRSYLDVLEDALKVIVRGAFQEMFEIAQARRDLLHTHPLEWTKRQVEILISAVKPGIRFWIKSVCDSVSTSPRDVTDDSIFWGSWRAPRLIHMQPAGNTRYDEGTAWVREELARSEEILDRRAERLTEFLRIELDQILRAAHVDYIKRPPSLSQPPPQRERAQRPSFTPTTPPSGRAQTPDFWRSLHDRFRELSEEELVLAPRNAGDRWLRAYVDYKNGEAACGQWHLSGGVNENSRERFEVEATRAGIALGSKLAGEPHVIWLHYMFSDLLEHESELLFAATTEGGIIERACEASAIYCARLEKQALIDARDASNADLGQGTGSQAAELVESESSPQQRALREGVIKKVKNPHLHTLLSTPEAAAYFQVKPRTIYRWKSEGELRSGARRGSITIDSVLRLEKKRSRRRPNALG